MAWDFTVASQESVTGRATTIRDDAFARLGDTNLADRMIQGDRAGLTRSRRRQRRPPDGELDPPSVEGTIEVPCYLDQDGLRHRRSSSSRADGRAHLGRASTTRRPVPLR